VATVFSLLSDPAGVFGPTAQSADEIRAHGPRCGHNPLTQAVRLYFAALDGQAANAPATDRAAPAPVRRMPRGRLVNPGVLLATGDLGPAVDSAIKVLGLARIITGSDADALAALVGATILCAGESGDDALEWLAIAADAIAMARAQLRARPAPAQREPAATS